MTHSRKNGAFPNLRTGFWRFISRGDDLRLRPGRWDSFAKIAERLDVAGDGLADGIDCVVAGGAGGDAAREVGHVDAEGSVVGRFDDDGVFHGSHFSPACLTQVTHPTAFLKPQAAFWLLFFTTPCKVHWPWPASSFAGASNDWAGSHPIDSATRPCAHRDVLRSGSSMLGRGCCRSRGWGE